MQKVSISDCPFIFEFYTDKTIETKFAPDNTTEDEKEVNNTACVCDLCKYDDCDFKVLVTQT